MAVSVRDDSLSHNPADSDGPRFCGPAPWRLSYHSLRKGIESPARVVIGHPRALNRLLSCECLGPAGRFRSTQPPRKTDQLKLTRSFSFGSQGFSLPLPHVGSSDRTLISFELTKPRPSHVGRLPPTYWTVISTPFRPPSISRLFVRILSECYDATEKAFDEVRDRASRRVFMWLSLV